MRTSARPPRVPGRCRRRLTRSPSTASRSNRAHAEPPAQGGSAVHVLITGAGGFLGAALTQALLARGDTVTAFDTALASLSPLSTNPRLTLAPGDITDMASVARVMLAAKPDAV